MTIRHKLFQNSFLEDITKEMSKLKIEFYKSGGSLEEVNQKIYCHAMKRILNLLNYSKQLRLKNRPISFKTSLVGKESTQV